MVRHGIRIMKRKRYSRKINIDDNKIAAVNTARKGRTRINVCIFLAKPSIAG